jgi:hypothetical protein
VSSSLAELLAAMARMGVEAVLKFVLDHCFETQRLSLIG